MNVSSITLPGRGRHRRLAVLGGPRRDHLVDLLAVAEPAEEGLVDRHRDVGGEHEPRQRLDLLALAGDAEEPAEKLEAVGGAARAARRPRGSPARGRKLVNAPCGALDRQPQHLAPQRREHDRHRLGRGLLELEAGRRCARRRTRRRRKSTRLGDPRQRLRERHLVPALDDAVRGGADAEREAPAASVRERRGLLREQRRPAGEDADHAGPEPHALGPGRGERERGEPVGPVGLAAPEVGVAGRLRAPDQVRVVCAAAVRAAAGSGPSGLPSVARPYVAIRRRMARESV